MTYRLETLPVELQDHIWKKVHEFYMIDLKSEIKYRYLGPNHKNADTRCLPPRQD